MNYSCPMSFKQVDSNVSRLTSLLVASLVIAYLLYNDVYILYIVAIDFFMRLFVTKESSVLKMIAVGVKEFFSFNDKFVDSGAKRLAGYFGLIFVFMLIIAHYYASYSITLAIAAIFLSCSLLDVFLNFCLGCKIYHIIKKFYPSFMS